MRILMPSDRNYPYRFIKVALRTPDGGLVGEKKDLLPPNRF